MKSGMMNSTLLRECLCQPRQEGISSYTALPPLSDLLQKDHTSLSQACLYQQADELGVANLRQTGIVNDFAIIAGTAPLV